MSRYLQKINEIIASSVNRVPHGVVFGENIDRGSYISGLSRNLVASPERRIVNVGNCEYTHCGVGFGAMMGGTTAVLFVKQLDFMLLGIDHFVSTYHEIRAAHRHHLGSFTIVAAVYDQGFQGPQSSFNALHDICSLARVSGFTLTNVADAQAVADREIHAPGFRFLCLSQRLAGEPVFAPATVQASPDHCTFRYQAGTDLSIVCANFSLAHGRELQTHFESRGLSVGLLNVHPVYGADWSLLLEEVARTKRVIVLDDTKGVTGLGTLVTKLILQKVPDSRLVEVSRPVHIPFGVDSERFQVPPPEFLGEQLGI